MTNPKLERIIVPLPPSLLQAIEDYRFSNRVPSRAEAMRRILEAGLGALTVHAPADLVPAPGAGGAEAAPATAPAANAKAKPASSSKRGKA